MLCSLAAPIQALQILTYGYGLHLSAFFGEVLATVSCVFAGTRIVSVEQGGPAAPQYAAAPRRAGAYIDVPGEPKKHKELLDTGAIPQEEFDAKKKQLLDL